MVQELWLHEETRGAWSLTHVSTKQIVSRLFFCLVLLSIGGISVICTFNALQWVNRPFAGFLLNERMIIGNLGRYHWTGTAEKLRYPDKIVTANGTLVSSMQDLERTIATVPVGQPISYSVERQGKTIEVVIATMRFTWADLLTTFGITFLVGMTYIFIGTLVFILKPDSTISWTFFGLCSLLGVYTIVSFDTQSTHWGFLRLYIAVLTFFPATFIQLSLIFPERKSLVRKHPVLQAVPYLFSTALVIPFQLLYPDPAFMRIYQLILGYLVLSALVFIAATLPLCFGTAAIIAKQRARVILLGASVAFPLPLLAQYLSLFGTDRSQTLPIQINFAALPVVIFPAAIAYAMMKHNLFDIDTIVRRTCGYILSTGALAGAYVLLVSILDLTARSAAVSRSSWFPLSFALATVFVFEPLRRKIQHGVDRLFYRQHYNYRKTIKDVSEAMTSLLNPDLIRQTLIGSVVNEMVLENGLFLLPDATRTRYVVQDIQGIPEEELSVSHLTVDESLLRMLQERNEAFLRYDIDLHPRYRPCRRTLRHTFEVLSSEIMLPMRYKDDIIGIVSFGRKKSGKMFTREDLDLLRTLTNHSAMALENARLFREYLEKGKLEEELKIAHTMQVSMLPERAPELPGFQIAARSIPAREVGGDFYDFVEISEEGPHSGTSGRVGIFIGDVCGKAVSAALLMAASRSTFRVLAESYSSVEDVMVKGNLRLKKDIKKGTFVALIFAVLDVEHRTLTLANAGQTPPILCSATQEKPVYIDTSGDKFPLGIVANCQYQESHVALHANDVVVFYTDGIVEAINAQGEMYGFERLLAVVEGGKSLSAADLLATILADISHFVGVAEQHDDLTLVVVRAEGTRPDAPLLAV